jgi:hypothetical protein
MPNLEKSSSFFSAATVPFSSQQPLHLSSQSTYSQGFLGLLVIKTAILHKGPERSVEQVVDVTLMK